MRRIRSLLTESFERQRENLLTMVWSWDPHFAHRQVILLFCPTRGREPHLRPSLHKGEGGTLGLGHNLTPPLTLGWKTQSSPL
jgi:hypothetical protein